MNKKIAMSAMSIFGALAILGGTTFAAFSSEATNDGNTFGSGELTLTLDGFTGTGSSAIFTGLTDQAPGAVTTQSILLANTGSVAASTVEISGITLGGDTGLGDVLSLEVFKDDGDNSFEPGVDDVLLESAVLSNGSWTNNTLSAVSLAASGGSQRLYFRLTFDPLAGNPYQGLNLTFDIGFRATQ